MSLLTTPILWRRMVAAGDGDFLVTPERRFSHNDLNAGVRRWLAAFDTAQLREGDRILIRSGNEFATISGFIAALLDGLVPVLLTADTPDQRALAISETVGAACLVADQARLPADLPTETGLIRIGPAVATARRRWFLGGKAGDALPGLPAPAPREPRLPEDGEGLAYILFTSGTTSSPSGVQISRGNLLANLATLSRLFEYNAASRIFNDMILAHADGLIQGPMLALANGACVIRSGGFQLSRMEEWLNRVHQERATHVLTVPTIWAMIDAYAGHNDYFDGPECRVLSSVAAKLPEDLWRRLEARFRKPILNQYGLTETVASALYAGKHREMGAFGTIGRPVDCSARIDPDSATPGEGELQLRGDNVFPGYWNDPARNLATFTSDGWMKTGDLARLREDGSYEIIGRIKTIIMTGGFLIRPDEIDEALLRHPMVRESVTVGADDALFGEIALTAVVCEKPVPESQLTAFARERLESHKVPKRIIPLERIPRGDAGKPRLNELRQMLLAAIGTHEGHRLADATLEAAVIAVAAEVFRVEPEMLSLHSGPSDFTGWDSFSQLSFLLAVEEEFAVSIPASRVAGIKTVKDMVGAVRSLQAK